MRISDWSSDVCSSDLFTERAFVNGKLDLVQAEAVADLIAAGSAAAARAARRSLDGVFSRHCNALADALSAVRMHVEAAIDFPDEENDFLSDRAMRTRLDGESGSASFR